MKTIIFNGREFASKKEAELSKKVATVKIRPIMATILVGENPASKLYVSLKQKAAERVGIQMDVYEFSDEVTHGTLINQIAKLAKDNTINGIMVQLPLPEKLKEFTEEIINSIPESKDVDGLREDSRFTPATVRAVLAIVDHALKLTKSSLDTYFVVVGAKGNVGKGVVSELTKLGFEVGGVDSDTPKGTLMKETSNADVLISATGSEGLITSEHVKDGAIVIDVGSPKGDVLFNEVTKKVKFITPVPGGVGPVTVISLLENLVSNIDK